MHLVNLGGTSVGPFITLIFIMITTVAYGQSCEDQVEELASIHEMLIQDPSIFLKAAFSLEAGLGGAGVVGGVATSKRAAPKDIRNIRRSLVLDRRLLRESITNVRSIITGAGGMKHNVDMVNYIKHFRPRAVAVIKGHGPVVRLSDARIAADKILSYEKITASLALRDLLAQNLLQTFKNMDKVFMQNLKINTVMVKLRKQNPIYQKHGMGLAGGAIGVLLGLEANRFLLQGECGPFGVDYLVGYFQTSIADSLSGEKKCYLTAKGAQEMASRPSERSRICKEYPKIVAALENSFDLYASGLLQVAQYKSELTSEVDISCQKSDQQEPTYKINVAGTDILITQNEEGAHFKFYMKGSQAGPNGGDVKFSESSAEFTNTLGSRLRYQMGDSEDYQGLINYYLKTQGVPVEPTLQRRYLTGASLIHANMYRNAYIQKCAAPSTEEYIKASVD